MSACLQAGGPRLPQPPWLSLPRKGACAKRLHTRFSLYYKRGSRPLCSAALPLRNRTPKHHATLLPPRHHTRRGSRATLRSRGYVTVGASPPVG